MIKIPDKDIIWKRFGRLLVIVEWDRVGKITKNHPKWERSMICLCDCWNKKQIRLYHLRHGVCVSCGCYQKEFRTAWNCDRKHNMSRTRFWRTRYSILSRTREKTDYKWRRARRWIKCLWTSFDEFKDDMYESYLVHIKQHWSKYTSIDRIDNDGHYCKKNCRWATPKQQSNNRDNQNFTLKKLNHETTSIQTWT